MYMHDYDIYISHLQVDFKRTVSGPRQKRREIDNDKQVSRYLVNIAANEELGTKTCFVFTHIQIKRIHISSEFHPPINFSPFSK